MKEGIMPDATWGPILHQLLARLEHFALLVLGLTGPGPMIPCVVKADNTAIRDCDDLCPLFDWLAHEGLAIR